MFPGAVESIVGSPERTPLVDDMGSRGRAPSLAEAHEMNARNIPLTTCTENIEVTRRPAARGVGLAQVRGAVGMLGRPPHRRPSQCWGQELVRRDCFLDEIEQVSSLLLPLPPAIARGPVRAPPRAERGQPRPSQT